MMVKKIIAAILIITASIGCSNNTKTISILVSNPTSIERLDEFVSIHISEIFKKYSGFDMNSFIVTSEAEEIPFQIEDVNGEKLISFIISLNAGEKKEIKIEYGNGIIPSKYKNETYAELSPKKGGIYFDGKFRGTEFESVASYKVPAIHKDHDALFKYEGPGWESEIVGYRLYLDWRNATDIFGKKIQKILLNEVGVHDTVASDDSYHKMQEWGMDIFKVGSTLGIGSFGMWSSDKVNMVSKTDSIEYNLIKNGPLKSEFTIDYYGWLVDGKKYSLYSNISINARSRLTKCDLKIENADNLVTGLAKYDGTNFIKSESTGKWQYIALYGKQSLADDDLGIAVLYNNENLIQLTEDKLSYVLVLNPLDSKVTYYFTAAWVQEPDGIKNEKEFVKYLDNSLIRFNNPLIIEF
jgi:hypothetical protein